MFVQGSRYGSRFLWARLPLVFGGRDVYVLKHLSEP